MAIDGILNVLKPTGKTSFEVVSLMRRLSGERRVGHGGTLDPEAIGVLPICLGQATRVIQFLLDSTKRYCAEIELGVSTDTYDSSGRVIRRTNPSSITREQVEIALIPFRGIIEQTPPMYSAVRHKGRHLYELARAGIEVERQKRRAEVFHLGLLDFAPPILTIEVECSKGTYIRSLAHDLGESLGCGSHMRGLVRTRSGIFDIQDGVTIPQLEDAFRYGFWKELIYPIDAVLLHLMAAIVDDKGEDAIRNGRPLPLGEREKSGDWCRAYSLDGRLLAMLHFEAERGLWKPERVFPLKA